MKRTSGYTTVLLSIIIFFINNTSFSQDALITGNVKYGNEILSAATVSIGNKNIFTDQNGYFTLSIKPGTHVIIITHAGYKKLEQTMIAEAGIPKNFEFEMIPGGLLEEVTMLGSRSKIQRSNRNTPVPVDVFSSGKLIETGQISLTQMLNVTAPSFNTSRELLNETATLRNLDPHHVLILMNGIRYHNMAWLFGGGLKGQLGRGSTGNDLNSIPFPAIEKIEILRDGATAQYGSDAIAGVMDIQLKKSTGKTSIQLHLGQYYKGDGEKFSLGLYHGISLNKKGFLGFSASVRYQEPTFRGGEYLGSVYYDTTNKAPHQKDSLIVLDNQKVLDKGFNRRNAVDNIGTTKLISAGLLINGGYDINSKTALFWTVTANNRKIEREQSYRFPKESTNVNFALFPDGFKPLSKPGTFDASVVAGVKGETGNNIYWEYSGSYGINKLKSFLTNANNPSQSYLGKNAPTSFYTGKDIYQLLTNDINFTKRFIKPSGKLKSLNLGWGAEWRLENFNSKEGDSTSWYNYDPQNYSRGGVGSAGPENAININRNVWSAYFEAEAEYAKHLLLNAAARYEYYSDFGSNIAGKLAARYKFSERFTLRTSVNNGFRAPSLQQRYLNSIQSSFINSGGVRIPVMRGTFPNDHVVTKAFGIPSLSAEKTINVSGGFCSAFSNRISLTVDAYWIQIKDRIVLSGLLDRSIPVVKKILDSIPGIRVDQVSFFTNAINTRTKGIDIVLDGNWNIRKGKLYISFTAGFNSTHLFGTIKTSDRLPADSLNTNTVFNIEERTKMEKGQPASKMILAITYKKGKTGFIIRNTRFGETAITPIFRIPTRIIYETFSPKIVTDISFMYSVKKWVTLTIGANNVFDVYPDRLKNYENTAQGSWIYSPEASPFGFNGGYYFLNLTFNW